MQINAKAILAKVQEYRDELDRVDSQIIEIAGKPVDTAEIEAKIREEKARHKSEMENLKRGLSKRANRTEAEKAQLHQLRLRAAELRNLLIPYGMAEPTERGKKIKAAKAAKREMREQQAAV